MQQTSHSLRLSVLVPVYNAERFLASFMQALAAQDLGESEVIFVDDASTDRSVERIRTLAERFPSVPLRLIRRTRNGGVSEARQQALSAARGRYVIYADPDDTMDAHMYEELVAAAEATGADLVWEDYFCGDSRQTCRLPGTPTGEDLIVAILWGNLHGATWNKLIRRAFIVSCGARFLSGRISLCEDVDFLGQVLAAQPKCVYHAGCHYRYRMVEGSAVHSERTRHHQGLLAVGEHLDRVLQTPRARAVLRLWRFGNYSAVQKGPWGKVVHLTYHVWRGLLRFYLMLS